MQPERGFKSALTKAFIKRFRPRGGWYSYLPPGPGSKRGVPDLLFCLAAPQGVLWVEAKSARGSLSDDQRRVINDLLRSGQRVCIVQEGGALTKGPILLADSAVPHIVAPKTALNHDPFWMLLWS